MLVENANIYLYLTIQLTTHSRVCLGLNILTLYELDLKLDLPQNRLLHKRWSFYTRWTDKEYISDKLVLYCVISTILINNDTQ